MDAIIALLAQALEVDGAKLLAAIEAAKAAEAAPEDKVPFTRKDGTTVMATPAQAAAWSRFREGAATPKPAVTQAVKAKANAKVVIGFRHNGELARRSAYVVADALGLDSKDYATRKALIEMPREDLLAKLAAAGVTYEVVPASQLG